MWCLRRSRRCRRRRGSPGYAPPAPRPSACRGPRSDRRWRCRVYAASSATTACRNFARPRRRVRDEWHRCRNRSPRPIYCRPWRGCALAANAAWRVRIARRRLRSGFSVVLLQREQVIRLRRCTTRSASSARTTEATERRSGIRQRNKVVPDNWKVSDSMRVSRKRRCSASICCGLTELATSITTSSGTSRRSLAAGAPLESAPRRPPCALPA